MNNAIFTVCVNFFLIIFLIFLQLIRIMRNPEKYDVIPGYDGYRRSKYFWPIGLEYSKASSVDFGFATPMLFVFPLGLLWYKFVNQFLLFGSTYGISFHLLGQAFALLEPYLLMTICFVLSSYLALFSRVPKDIQYTLFNMGKGVRRSIVWKKWTILLLVLFLVFFPIEISIMINGGYVNETELVYSSGMNLEKHEFVFTEIKDCEIIVDESSGSVIHYYITNDHGEQFDLCSKKIVIRNGVDFVLWEYVDARLGK